MAREIQNRNNVEIKEYKKPVDQTLDEFLFDVRQFAESCITSELLQRCRATADHNRFVVALTLNELSTWPHRSEANGYSVQVIPGPRLHAAIETQSRVLLNHVLNSYESLSKTSDNHVLLVVICNDRDRRSKIGCLGMMFKN